ncbi:MAG: NYN domain-containing protein [Lachnospiraceae bacterium]|nr:NYN domain-containing protein [Lachnospiraceae bacterium]
MKKLTVAVVAHVDAGKTTLAEAILHQAGAIRLPGRVDHGNAALDSAALERRRGITIFTGEASFPVGDMRLNLLDTPGHVDFSAETERTLSAADAALVVISGTDGVQAHTRTLWKLLQTYRLPTFLFVTKMDLERRSREEILSELQKELSGGCLDAESFSDPGEEIALLEESLLEKYLEGESPFREDIRELIRKRLLFPVCFGSGLKEQGIARLLALLEENARTWDEAIPFAARVHKISYDEKGTRLTHIKVLTGQVRTRDEIRIMADQTEKAGPLRRYLGARFEQVEVLSAGDIGVICGLAETAAGQGLGTLSEQTLPLLTPVMRFRLNLEGGEAPEQVWPKLNQLQEEDPTLQLRFDPALREIHAELMGPIQAEVLETLAAERFGLKIGFDKGRVLYKETLLAAVEGVGHFEPLRHYAEVHLLLEPLPAGSGTVFENRADQNKLARNWQRLILTHLQEKTHRGVLIGAPLTDVKITLLGGRSHLKHTEGGDFREATYRAVRQGLMTAAAAGKTQLLEPFYSFRIRVPYRLSGAVMNDIRLRSGEISDQQTDGEWAVLLGRAPVSEMTDYAARLSSLSSGQGTISLEVSGKAPCHNEEAVRADNPYRPEADLENSPDSVFCSHGAGVVIPWYEVPRLMHLPYFTRVPSASYDAEKVLRAPGAPASALPKDSLASDRELEELMMKEFGPIKRPQVTGVVHQYGVPEENNNLRFQQPDRLIIDGYNLLFAWEELMKEAGSELEPARYELMHRLQNYAAYTGKEVILVFDGYRVPGNPGEQEEKPHLKIVYTKENETADIAIEKIIAESRKNAPLTGVVTNDNLIRLSTIRGGFLRMGCTEFLDEYTTARAQMLRALERGEYKIASKIDW